jgi:soluble lytic murein transglycosylase
LLLVVLNSFVSCESGVVLGIPNNEVLEKLKNQNIDFILEADLEKMDELAKLHPSAPFYIGLLLKNAGDFLRAEALFEAALKSPSEQIRKASAEQLLPFLTQKNKNDSLLNRIEKLSKEDDFKNDFAIQTLKNAALYISEKYDEIQLLPETSDFSQDNLSTWNEGFLILANLHMNENLSEEEKQNLRNYFLAGIIDDAKIFAFDELQAIPSSLLTSSEINAIKGRIAVSKSDFNEGISKFTSVIEENQALFFVYIDLLHDLGRSYQFTNYQQEGIDRFSQWETWMQTGSEMGTSILTIDIPENRYRLLYFLGRIERSRENFAASIQAFTEAAALTSDKNQQDACIWYLLDAVLLENPDEILEYLQEYSPKWNDDTYFADILDRVSQYFAFSSDWEKILDVFTLIQSGKDGETIAKYAYIIARSIQEGFVSLEKVSESFLFDTSIAKDTVESSSKSFFRIAFEKSGQSFYYKALSASFLGEETNPFGRTEHLLYEKPDSSNEDKFEFMLRFFNYGAEQFAYSYFQNLSLNIEDQRIVAENFIEAEDWYTAIRVCSIFMNREDYQLQKDDLELFYPNPYKELIELHAAENQIPAEVFFGLVRTESAFDKNISSRVGAVGLAQLMPETALEMAGRIARRGGPNYIVDEEIDLQNPEINIHLGAWYLNYLTEYTGSPVLALVAYNGGMGRIRRWRAAKPDLPEDLFLETIAYAETRNYGRKVLGAAAAYGYLYYGLSMEAVIADIFR